MYNHTNTVAKAVIRPVTLYETLKNIAVKTKVIATSKVQSN